MKVGCHISIRGGYAGAAEIAHRIGAESFQYFAKNPRRLAVKQFAAVDAAACAAFCQAHGLVSIVHSPYPANLAADAGTLRQAVVAALQNDLVIADACGSVGVVAHFGKYKGNDPLQGYKNIIQCINEILTGYTGNARLLLENQAGEGTSMGTTLEELVNIRTLAERSELIGFCLDTCHAFASGLWNGSNWDEVEERGRALGYFDQLCALHLNDSVYPAGSGRDRHANIGRGCIGADAFSRLLHSPVLTGLPAILETAAGPNHTHADEIRYVLQLVENA